MAICENLDKVILESFRNMKLIDRKLAIRSGKNTWKSGSVIFFYFFFLHIPSSWVKRCWHIKNQLPGYSRSGRKAMSGEESQVSVHYDQVNTWTNNTGINGSLSLLLLSFSAHCFSPTSRIPRKLIIYEPSYFDQIRRNM